MKSRHIHLWSGPRNISTALMYSFAQRKDTKVLDEPLYAHYLSSTDASDYHPGVDEILANQENDGNAVISNLQRLDSSPVYFIKHMVHHLLDLDKEFMMNGIHVLLTRNPKDMLPSYAEVIENPSLADVGYKHHTELLTHLRELNIPVVVVNAKSILDKPEQQLKKLCRACGIPFDEAMLSWPKGPRSEDGVWAKYWYSSVHQSTHFLPYQAKTKPFPPHLLGLLEECMHYYRILAKAAI